MLDYRMETFLSLCETKSYTKTAKQLHLTQPSVTQHIKYLEQYYQCELFRYDGRQTTLTRAGQYLYDKMQILRVQETEIQGRLRRMYEEVPLRIGVTPSLIQTAVLDTLCTRAQGGIMPVWPHVADTSQLLTELQECKLDAAVLEADAFYDTQIEAYPLYQERLIAASSPALAKQLYGCTWQQLRRQTLLLPEPGSGLRSVVQKRLRSRGMDFHDFAKVWNVNSYAVARALLQQGRGVAFFMESAIRQDIAQNILERVYIETSSAFCTIFFVTMRGRLEQELLLQLRQQLEELQEQ